MDFLIFPTVQKKFLRYVLSRLNLFDTDKLDLDRLDVAWGKRSTVELRDVGFKLDVSWKMNRVSRERSVRECNPNVRNADRACPSNFLPCSAYRTTSPSSEHG
jgi:hypothetical protein